MNPSDKRSDMHIELQPMDRVWGPPDEGPEIRLEAVMQDARDEMPQEVGRESTDMGKFAKAAAKIAARIGAVFAGLAMMAVTVVVGAILLGVMVGAAIFDLFTGETLEAFTCSAILFDVATKGCAMLSISAIYYAATGRLGDEPVPEEEQEGREVDEIPEEVRRNQADPYQEPPLRGPVQPIPYRADEERYEDEDDIPEEVLRNQGDPYEAPPPPYFGPRPPGAQDFQEGRRDVRPGERDPYQVPPPRPGFQPGEGHWYYSPEGEPFEDIDSD